MYKDKQTEEEEKKGEGSRAGARLCRPSSEENSVAGGRVPEENSVAGGRIPEENSVAGGRVPEEAGTDRRRLHGC
jgi:hypothetical protein